jgi:hypothetical protein
MATGIVREDVPTFKQRVGDHVLAGSNNATIVLGRDRPAGTETGHEKGAGTVHIVVGRASRDPSFKDDRAFVYVSAKTDADSNLGLAPQGKPQGSAVVTKADNVRIVADSVVVKAGRATLTITSDGRIELDGDVHLGKAATSRILKGELFIQHSLVHYHPYVPGQPQTGPAVYPLDPTLQSTLGSPFVKLP